MEAPTSNRQRHDSITARPALRSAPSHHRYSTKPISLHGQRKSCYIPAGRAGVNTCTLTSLWSRSVDPQPLGSLNRERFGGHAILEAYRQSGLGPKAAAMLWLAISAVTRVQLRLHGYGEAEWRRHYAYYARPTFGGQTIRDFWHGQPRLPGDDNSVPERCRHATTTAGSDGTYKFLRLSAGIYAVTPSATDSASIPRHKPPSSPRATSPD